MLHLRSRQLREYFGLTSAVEFGSALSLFILQAVLKVWNVFHYRFDSDESQHLHVIWAWTHGFVQYRDVFDNHMPLFQLSFAPLLTLAGENAVALYWMRLLVLPFYFLNAWCIYRIGAAAFSRRVGVWAALLTGGIASYHFCSTEFRTDDLWTSLWLLCLVVVVEGNLSLGTFLLSGLLLGLCYAVSMKTTIMLLAIMAALASAIGFVGSRRLELSPARITQRLVAFILCIISPPLVIALFFAGRGVWPQFYYCVIEHNVFADPANRNTFLNPLALVVGLPLLMLITRRIVRNESDSLIAFRRAFVFGISAGYILFLRSLWRHLTHEDYLPFYPLLALIAVAGLFALSPILQERFRSLHLLAKFPGAGMAAILVTLFDLTPKLPISNDSNQEIQMVRDVLALTNPEDFVFDPKGQTVFRQRAIYHVFETLTLNRMKYGLIDDETRQRLVQARACVAVIAGAVPAEDRVFIRANYLAVGHGVLVAGSLVQFRPNETAHFWVTIPARYALVTPQGPATGLLDQSPYSGPRFLETGEHQFSSDSQPPSLAFVWAQAIDRQFTPFGHPQYPDGEINPRPHQRLIGKIASMWRGS